MFDLIILIFGFSFLLVSGCVLFYKIIKTLLFVVEDKAFYVK